MTDDSSEPQIDLRSRSLVLARCELFVQRAEELSREAVDDSSEEEQAKARADVERWLWAAYDLAYQYYKENKEWLSEDFAFPPELGLDLRGEIGNPETQDVVREWANYHMREFYPWLIDRRPRGDSNEAPGL